VQVSMSQLLAKEHSEEGGVGRPSGPRRAALEDPLERWVTRSGTILCLDRFISLTGAFMNQRLLMRPLRAQL
jgi:hypothetical protein